MGRLRLHGDLKVGQNFLYLVPKHGGGKLVNVAEGHLQVGDLGGNGEGVVPVQYLHERFAGNHESIGFAGGGFKCPLRCAVDGLYPVGYACPAPGDGIGKGKVGAGVNLRPGAAAVGAALNNMALKVVFGVGAGRPGPPHTKIPVVFSTGQWYNK